jgi:hypothetical protein
MIYEGRGSLLLKSYLGIRQLYPKYPILLVTPPHSEIRLATREVYVDVPWQVYIIYILQHHYYEERDSQVREKLLKEIGKLEKDIKKKLGDYADLYKIVGPVRSKGKRPYLKLTIKWDRLIDYFEWRASSIIDRAKNMDRDGTIELVREFYANDVVGNFMSFSYSGKSSSMLNYIFEKSPVQRDRFKRLLLRLGDLNEVKSLCSRLERAVALISRAQSESLPVQWQELKVAEDIMLSHVIANIKGIEDAALHYTDLHLAYLYMRRSMEALARLLHFYREIQVLKPSPEEAIDLAYKWLYLESVMVDRKDLKRLGIESRLAHHLHLQYSIVSEILHKIPGFPFPSLLEFKLFEHVLKWYTETLERIAGVEPPPMERPNPWLRLSLERLALKRATELVEAKHEELVELINILLDQLDQLETNAIRIQAPLIPSRRALREGLIIEDDLYSPLGDIVAEGYTYGIYNKTFLVAIGKLKELLARALLDNGFLDTSEASLAGKTAFYLLLYLIPEIFETRHRYTDLANGE